MKVINQKVKHKKTIWGLISFCIILLFAASYHKITTHFVSLVQPTFFGYNGNGQVTYNEQELAAKIQEYLFRKAGISKEKAQGLANGDAEIFAAMKENPSDYQKLQSAQEAFQNVHYGFEKVSNLKNGEKLTFKLYATDHSIPTQVKSFEVAGLNSYQAIDIADVLKEHPVTFSGYDGTGKAIFDKNVFEEPPGNGHYSTHDSVHLSLCTAYLKKLKSNGKIVENELTTTIKAEKLKDFNQISNLTEVLDKIDQFSKIEFKGYRFPWQTVSYSTENKGNYYVASRNSQDEETFLVLSIYEVERTVYSSADNKRATSTFYKALGYRFIPCTNDQLDLNHLERLRYYGSEQETLTLLLAYLEAKYPNLKAID